MAIATNRLQQVLRHLHASLDGQSDEQLLTQFVSERDEAAFAALVRRHGPMVLGVSRRILLHQQDAEDVFQATFLVLARKAHAVVQRETVGAWLHSIAHRTAQEARAMRTRRQAKEKQVADLPHPEVGAAEVQDWRPILDEELSGLPAKYRGPLVLCDLEAHSRKQAAQELRIPEGTLSSRLAKGRRLLAVRLARRGVTLAGAALTVALADGTLAAGVPGPLVGETARLATLVLSGHLATVSTPVAVLMKGALKTMFMAKFKLVAVLLLAGCLTLGVGSVSYHPAEAQHTAPAGRPANELEALRRENALLKLNLEVVLEKVRAQGAELQALKPQAGSQAPAKALDSYWLDLDGAQERFRYVPITKPIINSQQPPKDTADPSPYRRSNLPLAKQTTYPQAPPLAAVEVLLRRLREAKTDQERHKAAGDLENVVRRIQEGLNQQAVEPSPAK